MNSKRLCLALAVPAVLGAFVACNNGESASPEPGKQAAPVTPTPSAMPDQKPRTMKSPRADRRRGDRKSRRGGFGVSGRFFNAALALDLKDDAKSEIEKIQDGSKPVDGKPAADSTKTAMEALNKEITAGIKAGKIDAAKLDPLYAEVDKAHKARQEAEAKALNELHAKLDATQRKAVADAIRADQKKRSERMEKMMEAKKDAPAGDEKAAAKPGANTKRAMGTHRLERLTRDLGLDDDQKKKVEALEAKQKAVDPKAMREQQEKRMTALVDAFEKDAFDATKLDLSTTPPMKEHSKAMVAELNALLGIVKPEQRDKLAEAVERQHAGRGGWDGRMAPRGPRMPGRMGPGMRGPGMMPPPADDMDEEEESDQP